MIGILGGTFDPIHNGHLSIADQVYHQLKLEAVEFIPCNLPPHREAPIATAKQRCEMIELAIANTPYFSLNTIDMERGTPSYMLDTVQLLKKAKPDRDFGLILGFDAFLTFDEWLHYQRIIEFCDLIIVNRPNHPPRETDWMKTLIHEHKKAIHFIEIEPIAISATQVRETLQNHQDVSTLLPNAVASIAAEIY